MMSLEEHGRKKAVQFVLRMSDMTISEVLDTAPLMDMTEAEQELWRDDLQLRQPFASWFHVSFSKNLEHDDAMKRYKKRHTT